MFKDIITLSDIDPKITRQMKDRFPYPSDACIYHRKIKPVEVLPNFDDLMADLDHCWDMGIENFCLVAGWNISQIVRSRANANKQAQLFNLFVDTFYGIQKPGFTNRYYKKLDSEQQNQLNQVLTDYLIAEYNQHIENLNYYLSEA